MQLDDNRDINDLIALLFLFTTFILVTSEVRLIYNVLAGKINDEIYSKSLMRMFLNGDMYKCGKSWSQIYNEQNSQSGGLHSY